MLPAPPHPLHQLHGTKLQSEVALLSREKIEVEARLELVLQEISSFEAGVRALEHEMATLTKAETQAAGTLDEAARVELKENKVCMCVHMCVRGDLDPVGGMGRGVAV